MENRKYSKCNIKLESNPKEMAGALLYRCDVESENWPAILRWEEFRPRLVLFGISEERAGRCMVLIS